MFYAIFGYVSNVFESFERVKPTSRLPDNAPRFRSNLCRLAFVDVPPDVYVQALLGIYEMGRAELLCDLFICAYERSTQEYIAIRQNLAEPDPLRLAHRSRIKDTVRAVVLQPQAMRKRGWIRPCQPSCPNPNAKPSALGALMPSAPPT